nr:unnamed protein product [Callosobruchus analis]
MRVLDSPICWKALMKTQAALADIALIVQAKQALSRRTTFLSIWIQVSRMRKNLQIYQRAKQTQKGMRTREKEQMFLLSHRTHRKENLRLHMMMRHNFNTYSSDALLRRNIYVTAEKVLQLSQTFKDIEGFARGRRNGTPVPHLLGVETTPSETTNLQRLDDAPASPKRKRTKKFIAAALLCQTCGRTYKKGSSLYIHLKYDCGKTPLVCGYEGCGVKTTRKASMKRHLEKQHLIIANWERTKATPPLLEVRKYIHEGRQPEETPKVRVWNAAAVPVHSMLIRDQTQICLAVHMKSRHPDVIVVDSKWHSGLKGHQEDWKEEK